MINPPTEGGGMIVVIVKCISCGATKTIYPGQVDRNSVPMCDLCCMPMTAIEAAKEA